MWSMVFFLVKILSMKIKHRAPTPEPILQRDSQTSFACLEIVLPNACVNLLVFCLARVIVHDKIIHLYFAVGGIIIVEFHFYRALAINSCL